MADLGKGFGQFVLSAAQTMQTRGAEAREKASQEEAERRKMELELEYRDKLAESAYELESRKEQEHLGRTIQQNTAIGQQLLNFAGRSTDPEERENFARLGKLHMSMSTLPSKDIVDFANTVKTQKPNISDKRLAHELQQEGLLSGAWDKLIKNQRPEDLQDPGKRQQIFGTYTKGMSATTQKSFADMVDRITPKKVAEPDEIKAARARYAAYNAQMIGIVKSRMRPQEKEQALMNLQNAINIEAETVNQYEQQQGKEPTMSLFTKEIVNVPRQGTIGQAVDWLFGPKEEINVTKELPGKEIKKPQAALEDRVTQILTQNPNATDEEIKAVLLREGYK